MIDRGATQALDASLDHAVVGPVDLLAPGVGGHEQLVPGAERGLRGLRRQGVEEHTPWTGMPVARPMVRPVTIPTRNPVNGPGPVPITMPVSASGVTPASASTCTTSGARCSV